MICALLDFEKVIFENAELPHFRCKMPNLPTDVPHQMAFELLQVFVKEEGVYKTPFAGTSLYFLDNAENYHNNSVTTGIYLTHLDCDYGTTTGGNSFFMSLNTKPIKIYISTKQNYLYFKIQDKLNQLSDTIGYGSVVPIGHRQVNKAKIVIRLTFDKTQTNYIPKRIML
jgi:hypothetical protein